MGKYSDQPEHLHTSENETEITCPFCNARNLFKYETGKEAEFQCHSCYSDIGVTIKVLRTPSEAVRY